MVTYHYHHAINSFKATNYNKKDVMGDHDDKTNWVFSMGKIPHETFTHLNKQISFLHSIINM